MKLLLSLILFSTAPTYGWNEGWNQIEPEIKSSEALVEIIVKNTFETPIACLGEASAITYFEDSQYASLQLAVINPSQSVSLFLRSRYGDPIVSVWTSLFCKKLAD